MKASEMTNEELANNTEEFANAFHNDSDKAILREAAARLRNYDKALNDCDNCISVWKRENCALRRRLKVAEDALELCISGMCGECSRQHPGETCVEGCYEMLAAKNALAAIREEKEAK